MRLATCTLGRQAPPMAVSVIVFAAHRVSGNTVPSKWSNSCLAEVAEPTEMRGICAGIVLMPGDTLPLKVVRRQDRLKLENALSAPAPFTRLIAVVTRQSQELLLASNLHVQHAVLHVLLHPELSAQVGTCRARVLSLPSNAWVAMMSLP